MQAEPDAALPPRSAPRSEHFARFEGKVSETPRAAADRDAATPRKTSPLLSAARTKRRLVLWKVLRLSRARQGGALPCFARLAARCRPNQTRHCRRVVRLGANTLHGASAACPKRRVRRRTGTRSPRARLPRPSAPPEQRDGQLCEKASPGFSPPHAASRTFSTTKENVRSDAHYVGRTGLRLGSARQGGALPHFARPAARCRPSQTRHCRRVVRLGANTLHGGSAACPKRRVRRRTGARPPRARLPRPPAPPGQRKGQL